MAESERVEPVVEESPVDFEVEAPVVEDEVVDLPPVTPMTATEPVAERPMPASDPSNGHVPLLLPDSTVRSALWSLGAQVSASHANAAEGLLPGLVAESQVATVVKQAVADLGSAHRRLTLALGLVQPR